MSGGASPGASNDVAVVGAGLAGAAAAQHLARNGRSVSLYDMGMRGPGGRTSTRQLRDSHLQFDHGAQAFRVEPGQLRFAAAVAEWERAGVAAQWRGRFGILDASTALLATVPPAQPPADGGFCELLTPGPVYVGVPGMNALAEHCANTRGVTGVWGTQVHELQRAAGGGWLLRGRSSGARDSPMVDLGTFRAVVLTDSMFPQPTSPGALQLPAESRIDDLVNAVKSVQPVAFFSLMVALPVAAESAALQGVAVTGSDEIQWLSCDSSKPGRPLSTNESCWVAIGTPEHAKYLLDKHADLLGVTRDRMQARADFQAAIAEGMWPPVRALLARLLPGGAVPEPLYIGGMRWGRAFHAGPLDRDFVMGSAAHTDGIALAGDMAAASRLGAVYESGIDAAESVLCWLADKERAPSSPSSSP